MARRAKTTVAEELMDTVSLLPWWGGVVLAFILYLVLHQVASQPVAVVTQPGQMGEAMAKNVFKAFAGVAQYVLPVVCLSGWCRSLGLASSGSQATPRERRANPRCRLS
jgi:restriction system protein